VRRFAGAWRFVCNNALALTKDRYTRKEKHRGMLAWPLCYLLGSKNLVGPPMFPTSSSTIAERFRSGLHKLFQGPGQFSSIPQEKQERQLPYSTRLRGGQRKRSRETTKARLRYRKSRDMEGKPKNITVSLGNGKIFISTQTEREVNQPLHRSM